MLYETFNSLKEAHGPDYFTSRISDEIAQNINPMFDLREYQKEALGRFDFYFNGYQKRQFPAKILFHMATGSGKTLIMAANILYLYNLGYRNFIFFAYSINIIENGFSSFHFLTKIKGDTFSVSFVLSAFCFLGMLVKELNQASSIALNSSKGRAIR